MPPTVGVGINIDSALLEKRVEVCSSQCLSLLYLPRSTLLGVASSQAYALIIDVDRKIAALSGSYHEVPVILSHWWFSL